MFCFNSDLLGFFYNTTGSERMLLYMVELSKPLKLSKRDELREVVNVP